MARASRWQIGLLFGLVCGLGAGLTLLGAGWTDALTAALATGLGGAVLGATLVHGQIRRQTESVGVLPPRVRRSAGRASLWGPVPEDPETRASALALARHSLAERERSRVLGVVSALVIAAMLVNLALRASPWWWVAVAAHVGLFAYAFLVLPRRLRRRIELLQEPAGG